MVTRIRDLPTSAASVTDLDDVGVQGTDSAGNISPAFKGTGAMLGRMNSGADALDDTITYCDPDDNTKLFRTDAANIPTGTTRVLDAERMYRGGAYRETYHTASGTHTFNTATTYFQIEAVGGGGGGGGADGQGLNTAGVASGGGSGFFGKSQVLAKGAILTGTVTIGAAGAAGAAAAGTGGNGGNTTYSDGTNSFTWGGGRGGLGVLAESTNFSTGMNPAPATSTGTIYGSCSYETRGIITDESSLVPTQKVEGGNGGSTPYGIGGVGGSSAAAGSVGTGYGAGGGGAAARETTTNYAGGAGTAGLLIVREW